MGTKKPLPLGQLALLHPPRARQPPQVRADAGRRLCGFFSPASPGQALLTEPPGLFLISERPRPRWP